MIDNGHGNSFHQAVLRVQEQASGDGLCRVLPGSPRQDHGGAIHPHRHGQM